MCLAALTAPRTILSLSLRVVTVAIPRQCSLIASSGTVIPRPDKKGEFKIYFGTKPELPVNLTLVDPFGIAKTYEFQRLEDMQDLTLADGVVMTKTANPEALDIIPRPCPRTEWEYDRGRNVAAHSATYDAGVDFLNDKPRLQLADPDARISAVQRRLLDGFDGKNALFVRRVKIAYDYEDTAILDYEGNNPLTGKPGHKVYEGEGGFYANFHYAVVPFEARYLALSRQELLSMAQGKLGFIDRDDLTPKLRTHSFLPGPYLSKEGLYTMCEWGDTAYQAKTQELRYERFPIWDWDLAANGAAFDQVIVIVWEGDEEDWMIADGLLDPFYLTDDVAGVFVVDKKAAAKPLVLKNAAGDFEMEVLTQ